MGSMLITAGNSPPSHPKNQCIVTRATPKERKVCFMCVHKIKTRSFFFVSDPVTSSISSSCMYYLGLIIKFFIRCMCAGWGGSRGNLAEINMLVYYFPPNPNTRWLTVKDNTSNVTMVKKQQQQFISFDDSLPFNFKNMF